MMRSPLKGLVLTFLLATSASLVSAAEILFIVAGVRDEPPSPSVADLALTSHVQDNGHTVTFFNSRDDEELTREAADAVDVVYISDSVSSGQVGAELKDHPTPLIMGESFAFDDMGWTGLDEDVDWGKVLSVRELTIVQPDHPLAAGLSGTITVYDEDVTMSGGRPGQGATVIAAITADPNGKAGLFVYEKGSKMSDGASAPAVNIGIFLFGSEDNNMPNGRGLSLFDAALNYVAPPVIDIPLAITSVERAAAGGVHIQWRSVPGAFYALDITDDLSAHAWDEIDDSIASGGDTTMFTLKLAEPSVRQLWIRVRLPR